MDGGAWRAAVHGVAKSRTRLSHFTFTFHFPALEKEMATHSSLSKRKRRLDSLEAAQGAPRSLGQEDSLKKEMAPHCP